MVMTRDEALKIATKARRGLETLYGPRLRGVYLYGSAARDQTGRDRGMTEEATLHQAADFIEACQRLVR